MKQDTNVGLALKNIWTVNCYDRYGMLKWGETKKNLITTEGLNHILETELNGGAQEANWYIGLKSVGAVDASDVMTSHGGWYEIVDYSQGTRPQLVLGSAVNGSIDNTANKGIYSITASNTVSGAFICSDSAKNGTAGVLYGVVDFIVSRDVISGDTLEVAVTMTASSV